MAALDAIHACAHLTFTSIPMSRQAPSRPEWRHETHCGPQASGSKSACRFWPPGLTVLSSYRVPMWARV